jgi:apolipoprotein N-acyltransferase
MIYARKMDPLVEQQSQALIVPAVDVITWGEWEHVLHARIVPVRAREYRLPLFRLASSGISVFADERGGTLAKGTYPGIHEILAARLPIQPAGRLPWDRYLALPIITATALVFAAMLLVPRFKAAKTG